jgi:acyl carrier protein
MFSSKFVKKSSTSIISLTFLLKKDFIVEFPDTFAERKDDDEELRKVKDLYKGDVSRMNREYQNKDRAGAGEYLPL